MKQLSLIFLSLFITGAAYAQHTFSIVAVDPVTGEIGSAGATCGDSVMWPGTPGAKLISSVVPGKFAIHTQAQYVPFNQHNAVARMINGDSPQQAIDWLTANDIGNDSSVRQYGIVDYNNANPRSAAFTGSGCMDHKNHILGPNYAIQGNILLGQQILDSMEARFLHTNGSLALKLMAALQGAKVPGADTRCMSNGTSSLSAFLRVAKPTDADSNLYIDINVGAVPTGTEPINVLQVKLDNVLSVKEPPSAGFTCLVYPNPSGKVVYFKFSGMLPDQVYIHDITGKRLREYSGSIISQLMTLDLTALNSGLYFVTYYKYGTPIRTDKLLLNN